MDLGLAQIAHDLDSAVALGAEDAFELLERLVAQASILGAEARAQEELAAALAALGFEIDWLEIPPGIADDPAAGVPPIAYDGRRVLHARLPGAGGPGDGRSLLVNGHLDVVPSGDPRLWRHHPFTAVREDGWLHGRGAGDMKAGWAMAVLAIGAVLRTVGRPAADLLVVGAIEEEATGNGTLASVRSGMRADAVLLPEPTALDLLVSGVGVLWVEVVVDGRAGHAESTPDGVSALDAAWTLVGHLRELADTLNEGLETRRYHVNVGTFSAGDWPSTVPGSARLGVRIGFPAAWSPDEAERRVRDSIAAAAATDPWLAANPPLVRASGFRAEGYALDPESPLVQAVADAHAAAHGGRRPAIVGTNGTTDARFYLNQAGVPALCYGPRVRNMHGIDEAVELASIVAGARTLARFMASWLGKAREAVV
jgi:acetylornithine deacetylase